MANRPPLVSASPKRAGSTGSTGSTDRGAAAPAAKQAHLPTSAGTAAGLEAGPASSKTGLRGLWRRMPPAFAPVLYSLIGALVAVGAMRLLYPPLPAITQDDVDAAVRESLEREPLPSQAAKAYEAILPSLVRVVGLQDDEEDDNSRPDQRAMGKSLGTGVVIVDNGTILTNLHVVAGAKKIRLRFFDGTESEARLVSAQPEQDLAVLKASKLPDDLEAATLRSTSDLRPGEHVIAVGYPFGIGPSVSYGVVSGLNREFRSPEGDKTLSKLIQFDAAANPGNSGGPLVTMDGNVVGIVTAILNPSEQRTFIGIGFAVPIESATGAVGMHPF